MFDILHIVDNSSITLLRTDKILAIGHDPSTRRRGICLFESSPSHKSAEVEMNRTRVVDTDCDTPSPIRPDWRVRTRSGMLTKL